MLSITYQAFNNASTVHILAGEDDEGEIKTIYSVKAYPYMTYSHAKGVTVRNQPVGRGGKCSEISPVLVARFRLK